MTKRVAILISGSGSNMMSLLDSMAGDHPARPVLVLSNRPDAEGLTKASARGVATTVVDHRDFGKDRDGFDDAVHQALLVHHPDIICCAGFMRIFGGRFVTAWAGKMLNIHPSLLPKYKGLHTHARAIEAGDTEAGCSVHVVTPELDDGPILGQARVPVSPDDTADTLAARVLVQEHLLYPLILHRFANGETEPVFLTSQE